HTRYPGTVRFDRSASVDASGSAAARCLRSSDNCSSDTDGFFRPAPGSFARDASIDQAAGITPLISNSAFGTLGGVDRFGLGDGESLDVGSIGRKLHSARAPE